MKKLILAAFALTTAASVFAQGTVAFNNNVAGTVRTHIYMPLTTAPTFSQIGNGTSDTTAGATSWAGFSLMGSGGLLPPYAPGTTLASLIGAPGSGAAEGSLTPGNVTTTFRTGLGAGFIAATTATFAQVGLDSPATLEMVAWDNASGLYPTWTQAFPAWTKGLIAAGEGGRFNATLGGTGANPNIVGSQSFNLYFAVAVPEPSTFALAGLGLAALVAFRRRSSK